MPSRFVWPVLGLLTACGGSTPDPGADPPVPNGRNVVFLVIDTLRADSLSYNGYGRPTSPSLSKLAERGAVFDGMYSQAPWTKPSAASMFTSLYPPQHQVLKEGTGNQLAPTITTVVEVLKEAGYRTAAVSENPHIQAKTGFDQGFDSFEKVGGYQGDAEQVVQLATDWIGRRLAESDAPFFLYLHFLDPHGPYTPTGEHVEAFLEGLSSETRRVREGRVGKMLDDEALNLELTPGDVEYLRALYDAEIREVDDAIGKLLAYFDREGLNEDTVIVFTSDHGEEFLEHATIKHGYHVYEESVRVPLVIAAPGVEAQRNTETLVQHVDLAPTVLDLCGLHIPKVFQGRSLRPLLEGGDIDDRAAFLATSWRDIDRRGVRHDRWKLVVHLDQDKVELFDVVADPGEQRDLAAEHPDVVERLARAYDSVTVVPAGLTVEGHRGEKDPELEAALKAIGYSGDE